MSSEIVATWIGTVAAVGSAVAATMAWKAATASAKTAAELTALEAARRHEELTPKVTVRVEPFNPGDTEHYRLVLGLDGPLSLKRLESLTITVRDDQPGRDQETLVGGEATPEKVRAQVWGPLRFSPSLGPTWAQADETGRTVIVTKALDVGEGFPFQLERTHAPSWYHQQDADAAWRRDAGTLLRLSLRAVSQESDEPWTVPIEIDLAALELAGFAPSTPD